MLPKNTHRPFASRVPQPPSLVSSAGNPGSPIVGATGSRGFRDCPCGQSRSASGNPMQWIPTWGRLLLLTFLGEARKVSSRRATPGSEAQKHESASPRRRSRLHNTAHPSIRCIIPTHQVPIPRSVRIRKTPSQAPHQPKTRQTPHQS